MATVKNPVNDGINRNVVLFICALSSFTTPFMMSSFNIAVPTIGREFALDAIWLSWISIAFTLSSSIFLVPFGKIADVYGHKKVLLYGTIVFALASLLTAFSNSVPMFISFRILQGIGASMSTVTAVAILMSVFPAAERGKALGISIGAVYLGISLGPFLGGLLTEHLGWRSIFLAMVPLGLIVITSILWKLKGEQAEIKAWRFDLVGSVLFGVALVALMYGLSILPALSGIWIILLGVFLLLAFLWWETKAEDPVLQVNLFRNNTVFVFSNLASLSNYSSTMAVSFLISLYLQYTKGLSPLHAGFIMICQPVVQTIFTPVAGRLSDRIEPRILASAGLGLNTIGLILFTLLGQDTHLGFLIVCLVIMGFGYALFASPNTNAIMSAVDKRFYGVASAMTSTMRQVGGMLSLGIAMLMFALFIGRVEITPEYYPAFLTSMRAAFIISAVLCFIGIFLSLARGNKK